MTLDVVESPRFVRSQIPRQRRPTVQWELGKQTDFDGGPDAEKTTYEKVVFHVPLPAACGRWEDAEDREARMEMVFKNEW